MLWKIFQKFSEDGEGFLCIILHQINSRKHTVKIGVVESALIGFFQIGKGALKFLLPKIV